MELTLLSAKIDDDRVCLDEVTCRSSEAGIDRGARTAMPDTSVGSKRTVASVGRIVQRMTHCKLDG